MTKKREVESQKIKEIREKIKDPVYIQGAVQRLALVISNKILEDKDILHVRK